MKGEQHGVKHGVTKKLKKRLNVQLTDLDVLPDSAGLECVDCNKMVFGLELINCNQTETEGLVNAGSYSHGNLAWPLPPPPPHVSFLFLF